MVSDGCCCIGCNGDVCDFGEATKDREECLQVSDGVNMQSMLIIFACVEME